MAGSNEVGLPPLPCLRVAPCESKNGVLDGGWQGFLKGCNCAPPHTPPPNPCAFWWPLFLF